MGGEEARSKCSLAGIVGTPSRVKREGGAAGKMARSKLLSYTSQGKPYRLQASMYILVGVVNTFNLVEPAFLTPVPKRVRINCKLMWVVKNVFP